MPLDNTASLNDIITALQTIEGINAKADLASVVGSPALSSDSITVINSVIQNSKNNLATKLGGSSSGSEPLNTLVDRLTVGIKSASGTANASSNATDFILANGNPDTVYQVLVNNLDFKPKLVVMNQVNGQTFCVLFPTVINSNGSNARIISGSYPPAGVSSSALGVYRLQGSANVYDGGFSLPSRTAGTQYDWYAFE